MKKIKNALLLVLIAAMVTGLLCGCESTADKMEALSGTWTTTAQDSEEQALILLEGIDLYEEEIAAADLSSLKYVLIAEFDTDGNYRFAYDVDGVKAYVREFYVGVFDALYENRISLNETYNMEFDQATEEEFRQFYADLYGMNDFDSLIDEITEGAYDYAALAEDIENGTYTIKEDRILCTITGETEAEYMTYKISDNSLTLIYSDGEEVYTKVN